MNWKVVFSNSKSASWLKMVTKYLIFKILLITSFHKGVRVQRVARAKTCVAKLCACKGVRVQRRARVKAFACKGVRVQRRSRAKACACKGVRVQRRALAKACKHKFKFFGDFLPLWVIYFTASKLIWKAKGRIFTISDGKLENPTVF